MAADSFAATMNFSSKKKISQEADIPQPLTELRVGEKLEYDVYWMGFHVGLGTAEVREKVMRNGRPTYHIVAIARTNDFLSKLYPVQDEIHSFIDAQKFHSVEFSKDLKEGRYRAIERTVYDLPNKKRIYERQKTGEVVELPLEGPVHDPVSAFYWFRLQPIRVGQTVRTSVNSRDKDWDVEIKVLERKTKELRGGRLIDTILVEPKTKYREIFYDRGRVWVYFSADERRVPVWVTFRTPFGPVNGVLRSGSD
ncbi:MAG TPA: DUF3108 domain-containing protein [Candidatus Omnitrophota bacterium]|nr:DUF3108 domain-containing protein [Candidatus Omnitrophota bacterium]